MTRAYQKIHLKSRTPERYRVFRAGVTLLVAALALSLNGCAGYQLGSMLPPDIKTVHVPTFTNRTNEPLVEVATTRATIEELQRDGSLRVVSAADADVLLLVTVTRFDLSPLAFDSTRRTLANEYRLTMTADVTLQRRGTEEVVVDHMDRRLI